MLTNTIVVSLQCTSSTVVIYIVVIFTLGSFEFWAVLSSVLFTLYSRRNSRMCCYYPDKLFPEHNCGSSITFFGYTCT